MVRRRSTVRFRNGALDHKPGRRRLTCVNMVRRRLRVVRLTTADTGCRVLGEFGDDPGRYASGKARKNYAATSPITSASGKKKVVAAGSSATTGSPTR